MRKRRKLGVGAYLLLVVLSFLGWASYFKIDQTVRARGSVIAQARTQVVQVVEGGVVQEIFVREGDSVVKGQPLAQLKAEQAQAKVGSLQARIDALRLAKLRATAEANFKEPDFSNLGHKLPAVIAAQYSLYIDNTNALRKVEEKTQEELEIAQVELRVVEELYEGGDVGNMELLRSQRQVVALEADLLAARNEYALNARREIASIEQDVSSLEFELQQLITSLQHTEVTSPMDGIVTLLNVNTLGGVLRAGDELMQIAPTQGEYVIEAKVSPADIGELKIGHSVSVTLDAFDYSIYGSLNGELVYLSADTLSEPERTDEISTYYRAHVEVTASKQTNLRLPVETALKPGIPATIDINTGERSVLEFLAKPILRAFNGALTQR